MNDHLSVFPGQRLKAEDALPLISSLRRKYHQGPAEKRRLTDKNLQKYFDRLSSKEEIERFNLPDDIREYRILEYGAPLETLNFSAGGMVLTWTVFPETAIPIRLAIFSHPHFLEYSTLYFSWRTTGEYVWDTTALDVRTFFKERFKGMEDVYVFDKDLKWCIGVYDENFAFVVGDFKVF
jgi:hypothetical protein